MAGIVADEDTPIRDTDPSKSAIPRRHGLRTRARSDIVAERMAAASSHSTRRIVAVVVPPIDELDLVGPLQVFKSVNRLAARTIYSIEVVTAADRLTVEGESGVLTFVARHHFAQLEGACDSILLVCGLGTRSVRDASLSGWLKQKAT